MKYCSAAKCCALASSKTTITISLTTSTEEQRPLPLTNWSCSGLLLTPATFLLFLEYTALPWDTTSYLYYTSHPNLSQFMQGSIIDSSSFSDPWCSFPASVCPITERMHKFRQTSKSSMHMVFVEPAPQFYTTTPCLFSRWRQCRRLQQAHDQFTEHFFFFTIYIKCIFRHHFVWAAVKS